MKLLKIIAIAIGTGLLFTNCGTTLKRYNSMEESDVNNNLVKISVLPVIISETSQTTTSKTAFDLSERGQAAIFGNKNNEQLFEILNSKFQERQQARPTTIDLTTKNIRITFSISREVSFDKKNFSAFDRIENLKYSFEMGSAINPDIKFTKWNKYTTEYGTLDIGTLEFNQTFSGNLDATGELGANYTSKSSDSTSESSTTLGPKVSVAGKVGYTRSKKENQDIKQKFIQLTGEFGKRGFSIHQQGNRETELAGNVNIDLTISLPKDEMMVHSFTNLFDNKLNKQEAKDVGLIQTRYYIPDMRKLDSGVTGRFKFDFAVRNIVKRSNTFPEFDDKIKYITGHNEKDIILIDKDDLSTTTYFLDLANNPLQLNGSETVHFLDFEKALEFKTWLLQTITKVDDNGVIEISNYTISFDKISTKEMKKRYKEINIEVAKN